MGFLDDKGLSHLWDRVKTALSTKQDTLTGAVGQVVGFDATGAATAVPGWSNPNLLRNWDFRNPVNRNGQAEYASGGYTIDQWATYASHLITVLDDAIRIKAAPAISSNVQGFYQIVDRAIPQGATLTFSILYRSLVTSAGVNLRTRDENGVLLTSAVIPNTNGDVNLLSINTTDKTKYVYATNFTSYVEGDYIDLIAAKLELGSVQTLARQNEDGQWEIIDPPNYDLQYALCSLYSPSTGEWVGSQHSNPNLLINWYLASPINQKNQNVYSIPYSTGRGYYIDGWYFSYGTSTINVDTHTITLGPEKYAQFGQLIEYPENFHGKTLTASFLCKVTGDITGVQFGVFNGTKAAQIPVKITDDFTLFSATLTIDDAGSNLGWYCTHASAAQEPVSFECIAAKLELGPVQTLAHKEGDTWVLNDPPPNKALELAKCQRYQLVLSASSQLATVGSGLIVNVDEAQIVVPIPVKLRSNPTVSYSGNWQIANPLTDVSGMSLAAYSDNAVRLVVKVSGGLTPGNAALLRAKNDLSAKIILDANL